MEYVSTTKADADMTEDTRYEVWPTGTRKHKMQDPREHMMQHSKIWAKSVQEGTYLENYE